MCSSVKKYSDSKGFSLLELAIVMVLVGLIIAPATSIYHNYRIDKDWEETEDNINIAVNEIGGFRSVYARYPCPASQTAVPGDLNYGFEDCSINPAGLCLDGICTYSSNIAGEFVVVGALPFKTINLQESESYDAHQGRITYAVTRDLAFSNTFIMSNGGISIVNKDNISIIDPAHKAQFVIISHGKNKFGGYTRAGIQSSPCATGAASEQENCDDDAVFLSDESDQGFDDRIKYFSSVMPSEWQLSATDRNVMHLKNTNSFAVGVNVGDDLSDAKKGTVRPTSTSNGSVMTSGDFYSDRLCEKDAVDGFDCFETRLITGSLTHDGTRLEAETISGSGMSCYEPSINKDEYMVGIEENTPICEDEIYISCPDGSFITGIDGSGEVKCLEILESSCESTNITPTCGGSHTLEYSANGQRRDVYSGECRKITDYNSAYFATEIAGMSAGQINGFINNLNAGQRTIEDCGPSVSNSQIRDTYICTAGTWDKVSSYEKIYYWYNFPPNPNYPSNYSWHAETSYNGSDPNNNNSYHDCWCREDYRAIPGSCPSGFTGNSIRIQKHVCPQTGHIWKQIYTSNQSCTCEPGTMTMTQSCNLYYDEVNGTSGTSGLSGNVELTYDITCSNNLSTISSTPTVDASSCSCPSYEPNGVRNYCETGKTNSWTSPFGEEEGVEVLSISNWVCPNTTSGGLPDPGYWGALTPYSPIPACTCDSDLESIVVKSCPADLSGTGIKYEREWDCTTSSWEDEEDWELLENNCNSCTWKEPSGPPSIEDAPLGVHKGAICACGSGPAILCYDYGSNSKYDVWTGCQCDVEI